jgi:uncharacterized Fe-S radical SAM superfamily protein PflX
MRGLGTKVTEHEFVRVLKEYAALHRLQQYRQGNRRVAKGTYKRIYEHRDKRVLNIQPLRPISNLVINTKVHKVDGIAKVTGLRAQYYIRSIKLPGSSYSCQKLVMGVIHHSHASRIINIVQQGLCGAPRGKGAVVTGKVIHCVLI